MKQQYIQCIKEKGYVQEWQDAKYIYVRKEGQDCFCVMLASEIRSIEALERKRQQVERRYEDLGLKVHQLCILYQKDAMFSQEIMEMVEQTSNLWLLAEDQNRIFRYENQPMEFDGLAQALESIPLEEKGGFWKHITWENAPWLTLVLILVNLFCFFYPVATGQYGDWWVFGRNGREWTLVQGEWYRLITYMFLHADFSHIWNNMLLLGVLGIWLEPALGHIRYGLIYLLSGISAGLWSVLSHIEGGSIGASGAVYGLLGALLGIVLFFRENYRGKMPDLSPRRVVLITVLSLVSGLTEIRVDNAAHFGGVLTGIFLVIITNSIRKKCT